MRLTRGAFSFHLDDAAAVGIARATVERTGLISSVADDHGVTAVGAIGSGGSRCDAMMSLVKVVDVGCFGVVGDGLSPCFDCVYDLFDLFVCKKNLLK